MCVDLHVNYFLAWWPLQEFENQTVLFITGGFLDEMSLQKDQERGHPLQC